MPPVSDSASLVIGLLVFVPAIEAGYRAVFGRGGVLAAAFGGLLAYGVRIFSRRPPGAVP